MKPALTGLAAVFRAGARRAVAQNAKVIPLFTAIVAYYIYFVWHTRYGLYWWFSGDDLMNLHYYWFRGGRELLVNIFTFWTSYYRPMGGVFYFALYTVGGFTPLAFHIAALALLSVNVLLLYFVVSMLISSRTAGILALFLGGMHGAMVHLYVDTGMIYDVIAYLFYYSCFLVYLRVRRKDQTLTWRQTAVVAGLMIAAFESKEISVTLPFAIALYELIWHPVRLTSPKEAAVWLRGPGRVVGIGFVLAAVFLVGKWLGRESLFTHPAYQPSISLSHYFENYGLYLAQFLYVREPLASGAVVFFLVGPVMAGIAFRRKYLIWAGLFNTVSVIPIAFIEPRGGFAFYVPFLGWVVAAVGLIMVARDLAARVTPARFRAGFPETASVVMVLVVAAWVLPLHARLMAQQRPLGDAQEANRKYWVQIQSLVPAPPKGARFLALDDPYPADSFDFLFLLRLGYGDRSLQLDRLRGAGSRGIALDSGAYDYILDYEGGQFAVVASGEG